MVFVGKFQHFEPERSEPDSFFMFCRPVGRFNMFVDAPCTLQVFWIRTAFRATEIQPLVVDEFAQPRAGSISAPPLPRGAWRCELEVLQLEANRVKAHAEDKQVTICMEYLNSKVNHKDYMFDHIAWGVDVMKRVNSPRVKILYDIYHAQIMDGDIVRNIRDNFQWIGHFHTGGNPGRHEIDDTQELNYRFIMKAIADLGYTGFVSHEYSPSQGHDPIVELEKAIEICDQ